MSEKSAELILKIDYGDRRLAEIVELVLRPENFGFIKTCVNGGKLVAEIKGNNLKSLLYTLEDYLRCLKLAEDLASYKTELD